MGENVELRITKEVLSLSSSKYVVAPHRGRRSTWSSMFVLVGDQQLGFDYIRFQIFIGHLDIFQYITLDFKERHTS